MRTHMLTVIRFWHFHCPECGMGSEELGCLAEAHDVHCEICFVDLDRSVRLHRWPADDTASAGPERAAMTSRAA